MRKRKLTGRFVNLSNNCLGEYRILPNLPGIRIYSSGLIVRESDSKILESVNSRGYLTCVLTDIHGNRTGYFNHRLVAMAFLGIPENASELEVNHKDFNKKNNAKDNLEWVTPRKNLMHSGYNDPDSGIKFKPIQVRNFDTKEIRAYDCMLDCSRETMQHKDTVQYRVNSGDGRLWEDRLQYRLYQGDAPWDENPEGSFVEVLDIFTGKVAKFRTSEHAAVEYGISPASMSVYLSQKKGFPFKNRFITKFEHDRSPWPDVRDPIKYIVENTQQVAIEIENPTTGHRKLFLKATECALEMGLRPTTLNMRLKSNRPNLVYSDGYRYKYFSPAK